MMIQTPNGPLQIPLDVYSFTAEQMKAFRKGIQDAADIKVIHSPLHAKCLFPNISTRNAYTLGLETMEKVIRDYAKQASQLLANATFSITWIDASSNSKLPRTRYGFKPASDNTVIMDDDGLPVKRIYVVEHDGVTSHHRFLNDASDVFEYLVSKYPDPEASTTENEG